MFELRKPLLASPQHRKGETSVLRRWLGGGPYSSPSAFPLGPSQSRDAAAISKLDHKDAYLEDKAPNSIPIAHNTGRSYLGKGSSAGVS